MKIIATYSNKPVSDFKNQISSLPLFLQREHKFIQINKLKLCIKQEALCEYKIYQKDNLIIIGQIYCKSGSFEDFFNQCNSENIKQFILEQCYGSYIIINYSDNNLKLTRDPIGQLPLFYSKKGQDEFYFSNEIDMLSKVSCTELNYDWNYISAFLLYTFITSDSSAFENIKELPHGCSLNVDNNYFISCDIIWNPIHFCLKENNFKKDDEFEIVENLSSVIRSMIDDDNSKILLDFSGGLDSSSILLILKEILNDTKQIHALNMFHPNVASSDERKLAKELSESIGSHFIEFNYKDHLPITPIDNFYQKPNWPSSNLNQLKIERDIMNIAKDLNINKFISGHGGDHIFLCPTPIESIYDYINFNGFKNLYEHMKQFSIMGRVPMPKIIMDNIGAMLKYKLGIKYSRDSIFYDKVPWINNDIINRAKKVKFHPIFNLDMSGTLPGKFSQLENIFTGLSTIRSSPRQINQPIFYPLFSQPMIELSLMIPTFKSYKSGYNRYPFRKSVDSHFRFNQNIWRKDKGEITGVVQRGMAKNRDYIMDLCLEGKCMSSGFIDKKNKDSLHSAINDLIGGKSDYLWPIENLVALEIFFELWKN